MPACARPIGTEDAKACGRGPQQQHGSAPRRRAEIPDAQRLPDAEADLETIRSATPTPSPDGAMAPEGVETVRRLLAVSSAKVRAASLDLSTTYTNEFVIKP